MKVYYVSDLHNDKRVGNILAFHPGDSDGVLVVAGDLNERGQSPQDLDEVAHRWRAIIFVPGNHDWFGLSLNDADKLLPKKSNVFLLNRTGVVIDDVEFVGCTLWSDANRHGTIWSCTSDARMINGITAEQISARHWGDVKFINKIQSSPKLAYTRILVTHQAIHEASLDPRYDGDPSNPLYAINRPELLIGFDYHIHGHIHKVSDYGTEHGCRVLCNPSGYSRAEVPDFELLKHIEVN
ncbi:metallo-phosphoesterase [Vibrio phage EniLVp02]